MEASTGGFLCYILDFWLKQMFPYITHYFPLFLIIYHLDIRCVRTMNKQCQDKNFCPVHKKLKGNCLIRMSHFQVTLKTSTYLRKYKGLHVFVVLIPGNLPENIEKYNHDNV